MELNFTKEGNNYVAEFSATGDFNLHVERPAGGLFKVEQRTSESGQYASVEDLGWRRGQGVIDLDFTGVVYPKSIKVVSEVEPTMGVVTFNA